MPAAASASRQVANYASEKGTPSRGTMTPMGGTLPPGPTGPNADPEATLNIIAHMRVNKGGHRAQPFMPQPPYERLPRHLSQASAAS